MGGGGDAGEAIDALARGTADVIAGAGEAAVEFRLCPILDGLGDRVDSAGIG